MRRTCFNCQHHETCTKVREVCKSMVFRLRKFDFTFLDNTAKYCNSYTIMIQKKTRKPKEVHPGLFD